RSVRFERSRGASCAVRPRGPRSENYDDVVRRVRTAPIVALHPAGTVPTGRAGTDTMHGDGPDRVRRRRGVSSVPNARSGNPAGADAPAAVRRAVRPLQRKGFAMFTTNPRGRRRTEGTRARTARS